MYYNLWVASLIIGFLLLTISISLALIFKVPDLIDELSGRKAKRQIKRLRELNNGTGSLEGDEFSTTDFYRSISSGFLFAEEMEQVSVKPVNLELDSKQEVPSIQVNSEESTTSLNEGITDLMECNDSTSSLVVESTSFIDESDVTSLLSDVEIFSSTKHVVLIIEEQSSIEFKEEI